jgi:hypothetical protein
MKLRMLQLSKKVLWMGLLVFGWQTAFGFSLLGPVANGTEDSFQVTEIGYNPMSGLGPPGFGDDMHSGPKNLGEGYRLNTPVLYYTFDPSFAYFGSTGEAAVQQAFDMLNNAFTNNPTGMTNGVDGYSVNLTEFPLNSESVNYSAATWGLRDLKSTTLSLLLEQMGLADSVRYTWALIDRYNPPGSTCIPPGPASGYEYEVIERNYYYLNSLLTNLQYSAYVNNELYTYQVYDNCDERGASPGAADALEYPADALNMGVPVASGFGEYALPLGSFYTGLTRDDMAGLRYLLSSNNIFAPGSGYLEPSAAASVAVSGGGGVNGLPFQLTTSSLAILTYTDPVALRTLFPGLVIYSVTTNQVNGQTSYVYTFGNLVTYSSSSNTPVKIQVQSTTIAPAIGAPGGALVTNTTSKTTTVVESNLVSGDFYIVPTNSCGLTVLRVVATNATTVTNFLGTVTNAPSSSTTIITSTNWIITSTNHVLSVTLCTNAAGTTSSNAVVADFQGIEKVQFVRVSDDNYNYLTGQFYYPLTNKYSMVLMRNGKASTVVFQRVVTRPDILFMGKNLSIGGNDNLFIFNGFGRSIPNFVNSRTVANLSGPGIIDPTISSNVVITFNTVGPVYVNTSPSVLNGPATAGRYMIWGSFDGSTNAPAVYPDGTSIANLAAEALIQISPTTLPDATTTNVYNVMLSATGGTAPYAWGLASGSPALPANLTLSPGGVISGTPIQSGVFDFVVQMTDSSVPTPDSVQMDYSITIH